MIDIFFTLSFLTLSISAVGCAVWNIIIHLKRLAKAPLVNPINTFSFFAFIAFFLLFVPNAFKEYSNDAIIAFFSALFDALDGLSFGNRVDDMLSRVFEHFDSASKLYIIYTCGVIALVPFLAVRTVVAVFRDWFTQIAYRLNYRRTFHIFSELNTKSIIVAQDISKKDRKARIIFTSVNKGATEKFCIEQARRINALLTNKTLNGFRTGKKAVKKKLYLYFICEDKKKNIKLALDKFESVKNSKRETVVYLFSTDNTAERVVDLANSRKSNPKVKMELFNEAQRTAYNLIYEHPIYDVKTDRRDINVMILGAGNFGLEAAKAITWASQMINYRFSIRVFDVDRKNERLAFPLSDVNERSQKIGTTVNLEFFDCDIFSDRFDKLRFEEADYIIINLGDDSSNTTAALHMREIYARHKNDGAYYPSPCLPPKIITIIENEETKRIFDTLADPSIIPYGAMCDVFSIDNIINWKIDKAGEYLHACYYGFNYMKNNPDKDIDALELIKQGIKDYASQSQLNKRSSRAAAIHGKYKLFDIGAGVGNDRTDEILKTYNDAMLRCEHDRWNVFQLLDGWEPWDKNKLTKGVHKDRFAKLHAYLARFDDLRSIAEYIYGETEDPIEYDRIVVGFSRFALEYAESGIVCEENAEHLLEAFAEHISAKEKRKKIASHETLQPQET